MLQLDSASGKHGGRQPSYNGKQFSVTLDRPAMGSFQTVKNRKLAIFQVPLDRPRLASSLVGGHDRASFSLWMHFRMRPHHIPRRVDGFSRVGAYRVQNPRT